MRSVVLYQLLSLDGVAEEPSDWVFDSDEAIFDNLGRVIASQDDVLLGRGMYEYWVDYWPTSDVEPFAGFVNATQSTCSARRRCRRPGRTRSRWVLLPPSTSRT